VKEYNILEINEALNQSATETVQNAERSYHNALAAIAQDICRNSEEKPIVFISGPSGAGKSTSALRLAQLMETMGHKVHTIAMDDYFWGQKELEDIFAEEEVDWESPKCIDRALLSEHMQKMANHQTIEVPQFDFIKQARREQGVKLHCNAGDIVIIEGIHGLNPLISGDFIQYASKIYVEPDMQIIDDEHNAIKPNQLRLLRRLMRDYKYRGRTAEDTIDYFDKLCIGEKKYVFPFIDQADYRIDTGLAYEINLYRNKLLELFAPLDDKFLQEHNLLAIKCILGKSRFLSPEYTPDNSLCREFIGDSSLKY